MPEERLRVAAGIRWRRTVIRPRPVGREPELHFEVDGRPFSVAFDSVPDRPFRERAAGTHCLAVYPGAAEAGDGGASARYRIPINGDATAVGRYARWGPVDRGGGGLGRAREG